MRRWVTFAAVAALAVFQGCGCEIEEPHQTITGRISVEGTVIDTWGLVCQGDSVEYAIPIENTGPAPLDITAVTVTGTGAANFTVVSFPARLERSGSSDAAGEVVVAFSPVVGGPVSASLRIESSDKDTPELSLLLNGRGSEAGTPRVDIVLLCEDESGTHVGPCPGALNFGEVAVDNVREMPVIIENMGCAVIDITDIRVTDFDGNPTDIYSVTAPETPFTVNNAVQQTIVPTFSPVLVDTFTGRLHFDWSDPHGVDGEDTGSRTISLLGTGIDFLLVVEPRAYTFADAAMDQPQIQTFTIRNLGGNTGVIETIGLQTTNPEFTITPPAAGLPFDMPGYGEVTFEVQYLPVDNGRDENAILIGTNYGVRPPVRIVGGAIPAIEVIPSDQVDFGQVETGGSATEEVTVSNVGKAPLLVSELRLSDITPEGIFSFETDPLAAGPVTLAVGESLSFTVRFDDDPTIGTNAGQGSSETGEIEIVSDDPGYTDGIYLLALVTDTARNTPPIQVFLDTFVEGVACTAPPCDAVEQDTVTFDASRSVDPDGDPIGYTWSVTERPAGGAADVVPDAPDSAQASLVPDYPGTWKIKVVAADQYEAGGSTTVTLAVTERP